MVNKSERVGAEVVLSTMSIIVLNDTIRIYLQEKVEKFSRNADFAKFRNKQLLKQIKQEVDSYYKVVNDTIKSHNYQFFSDICTDYSEKMDPKIAELEKAIMTVLSNQKVKNARKLAIIEVARYLCIISSSLIENEVARLQWMAREIKAIREYSLDFAKYRLTELSRLNIPNDYEPDSEVRRLLNEIIAISSDRAFLAECIFNSENRKYGEDNND